MQVVDSIRAFYSAIPVDVVVVCEYPLSLCVCYSEDHDQLPIAKYLLQGLSQAAPLRQSRTAIGIVPLKNGQGDNLSPSKFWEKTRKEAHTKRFISVQKLQAETECGKYILLHL